MVEDKPGKWRWYHHVILVVAVFVFGILWTHVLRPSGRVADIVLAVCAVVFVASFTAIQIRRRRQQRKV